MVVRYSRRYSEDAKRIQRQLKELQYEIGVDGYFGAKSVECLRDFQADRGLKVDGIAGPMTQAALKLPGPCKFQAYRLNRQTKVFKMRKDKLVTDKINTELYFGIRRLSVLSIWRKLKRKPTLIVNGGLFDNASGHPLNKAKDEGKNTGSVYFDDYGLKIDYSGRVSFGNDTIGTKDFLGGSPALHKEYKKQTVFKDIKDAFSKNRHPRQYIGEDEKYLYVVFVYGRSVSWRGETLKEGIETLELIGANKNSINNDGGGSLQARDKKGRNAITPISYRAVPNAIAFYVEGR